MSYDLNEFKYKPSDNGKFVQDDHAEEFMKRFTQGLPKVSGSLLFGNYKVEPPDPVGVCETFHPESKTYCPEEGLMREDAYNHFLCEKCYRNWLERYR